jgi:hypothetical protein
MHSIKQITPLPHKPPTKKTISQEKTKKQLTFAQSQRAPTEKCIKKLKQMTNQKSG